MPMMQQRWTWLAVAVAASGCGARWISAPDRAEMYADAVEAPVDAAARESEAPDARACLATGARCRGGAPGCCVGYCNYSPYVMNAGVCVMPSPDGEACDEDRACRSGRCVDALCRASACAATGADCDGDVECCAGFCTASALSYAPGRCALARAAGAPCEGARWCESGRCVDSVCVR